MATTEESPELSALRAQVRQLERELVDQAAQAGAAVASAEDRALELMREHEEAIAGREAEIVQLKERLYWLDHWNVDLNELMRRPGADSARAFARGVRDVSRLFKRFKRRLLS